MRHREGFAKVRGRVIKIASIASGCHSSASTLRCAEARVVVVVGNGIFDETITHIYAMWWGDDDCRRSLVEIGEFRKEPCNPPSTEMVHICLHLRSPIRTSLSFVVSPSFMCPTSHLHHGIWACLYSMARGTQTVARNTPLRKKSSQVVMSTDCRRDDAVFRWHTVAVVCPPNTPRGHGIVQDSDTYVCQDSDTCVCSLDRSSTV